MEECLAKLESVLSNVDNNEPGKKKQLTSIIFKQLFYKYFINKISNYNFF